MICPVAGSGIRLERQSLSTMLLLDVWGKESTGKCNMNSLFWEWKIEVFLSVCCLFHLYMPDSFVNDFADVHAFGITSFPAVFIHSLSHSLRRPTSLGNRDATLQFPSLPPMSGRTLPAISKNMRERNVALQFYLQLHYNSFCLKETEHSFSHSLSFAFPPCGQTSPENRDATLRFPPLHLCLHADVLPAMSKTCAREA